MRAAIGLIAACSSPPEAAIAPESPRPPGVWAAPARGDAGASCLDVGTRRACWPEVAAGAQCARGACLVPRPLPEGPAPPRGYRCRGLGLARVCADARLGAGPFEAQGEAWAQRWARAPDDGEWECMDLSGAVVCRGLAAAAGVVPGPPDPGFTCGPRRGATDERICVDLAPDVPPAGPAPLRCRFDHHGGLHRVCEPSEEPGLGAPCAAARDCPPGAACAGGVCLPPRPSPSCWLDADCGGAACRFGSCEEAR